MEEPNDDFLIVEANHQAVLIEKYINKEIRFVDLQASLGLSRSNLRRRISSFRELGIDGLKTLRNKIKKCKSYFVRPKYELFSIFYR